jgi:hypothetical protein
MQPLREDSFRKRLYCTYVHILMANCTTTTTKQTVVQYWTEQHGTTEERNQLWRTNEPSHPRALTGRAQYLNPFSETMHPGARAPPSHFRQNLWESLIYALSGRNTRSAPTIVLHLPWWAWPISCRTTEPLRPVSNLRYVFLFFFFLFRF